ncbi:MAG: hypothetical protein KDA92_03450, partial [Planctomycetales bacterium]|nr:hypothetical protein [Planctomycetales bacterium]
MQTVLYYVMAPIRALFYAPSRMLSAPRRLMGLALPARVGILAAIFLLLLTITAYVGFFLSNDRTHWYEWTRPGRVLGILTLVALTPVVLYHTLRLWLEGDASRFPEIDRAWQEGIATLESHGIDVREYPLFLILGPSDERMCDRLMGATGYECTVNGEPRGARPLRFYADERGVYLFCAGLGCLGRMASLHGGGRAAGAGPSITSTLVAGQGGGGGGAGGPSITGTMVAGGHSDDSLRGTMSPSIHGTMVAGSDAAPAPAEAAPIGRGLTRNQIDEELAQLGYVGELIQRAR